MRRGLQQSPTCSQAVGACKLQRGSCIVRGAGRARAHADLPLFKRSSKRCVDHDQDVVDEAAHAATVITGVMNALAIEARPCFVGRLGLQDHACPLSRARCRAACPLSGRAGRTPPSSKSLVSHTRAVDASASLQRLRRPTNALPGAATGLRRPITAMPAPRWRGSCLVDDLIDHRYRAAAAGAPPK